jgi:hypothetical protein
MKFSQITLLDELKKLGYDAKVQEQTDQIYVIFKIEKREFPLFIRILHDGELLQLLTFIPCNVKKEHIADVARFLHMANKELDVPGFCMDETSSTIFYRVMLATNRKKEFDEGVLEAYLNSTQLVCKTFANIIVALAIGALSLEEVLKKANEMKTDSQPG